MKTYEEPVYKPQVVGQLVGLRMEAGVFLGKERPPLSQFEMAHKMGLKGGKCDETVGKWEAGWERPGAGRRAAFILYLWDTVGLRREPDRFQKIWTELCVGQWQWSGLNEKLLREAFGPSIPAELLAGLRAAARSTRLTAPAPEPLPDLSGFVGREAELAHFAEQLATIGLAVITGMAGMGKTSLAAMLARDAGSEKQIFWRHCSDQDDVDALLWPLAAFLQHHGQGQLWEAIQAAGSITGKKSAAELYANDCVAALSGHGYVLWLDDLQPATNRPVLGYLIERLVAAARAGGLKLIISSRVLSPYVHVAGLQPLAGLRLEDAVLFVKARQPDIDSQTIELLHARTDGNPQLLALAVDALGRTPDRAALLAQLASDRDVRAYLLHQVYDGLSDDERNVMIALACFERGATAYAVEAVLQGRRVQPLLDDLARRNLLQATPKTYSQHAIIRAFYDEQASHAERRVMHGRAARHYERVERNMLAASEHYLAAGELGAAVQLLTGDLWEAINQGYSGRLRELLEGFRLRQLGAAQWVAVNITLGQVHAFSRDVDIARSRYEQAYALAGALPDGAERAVLRAQACRCLAGLTRSTGTREALDWVQRSLAELAPYEADGSARATLMPELAIKVQWEAAALRVEAGFAHVNMAEWEPAIVLLNEALARLPLEADSLRAGALMNLGIAYCVQSKPATGIHYYEQALEVARECGDIWRMVGIRHNWAIEKELAGDWAAAEAEYVDALALAERIHASIPEQGLTSALGILNTKQGRLDRAEEFLRKAVDMARRYDLGRHLAASLSSLADLLIREGDPTGAASLLTEAQSLAEGMDAGDQLAEIERNWAAVRLAEGQPEAALEAVERSLAWARAAEVPLEEGMTRRVQGKALAALGRMDAACAAFQASVKLLAGNDLYETARTKLAWARELTRAGGDAARAETLRAEAATVLRDLGVKVDEVEAALIV